MKKKRGIYIVVIVLLVLCIIIFGKDLLDLIKLNLSFLSTKTETQVVVKDSMKSIKYAANDNIVENNDEILKELKELNNTLIANDRDNDNIFEIKNIHKIKDYYPEYKRYFIVKYKLFNMVEDIPNLYNKTKSLTDTQLENYFYNNANIIEQKYGIADKESFVNFANSLDFLNNKEITSVSIRISSIVCDAENYNVTFNLVLFTGENDYREYKIKTDYYITTDNQTAPYVTIFNMEKLD